MSDQVISNNVLAAAAKSASASYAPGRTGNNDSPLGEKFSFSEAFSASIDSPEKTYQDAQKPKDPADRVKSSTDSSNSDDDLTSKHDDDTSTDETKETDFGSSPGEKAHSERPNDRPHLETRPDDNGNGDEIAALTDQSQVVSKPDHHESDLVKSGGSQDTQQTQVAVAPVDSVKPQTPQSTDIRAPETPLANRAAEINTNTHATKNNAQVTSNSADNALASTLKDTKISQVGEDLHKAVFKNTTDAVIQQKAPSVGNALASKQEQDLSQRLKNSTFSNLKVTVDGNSAKLNSAPTHTNAPIAQFAELSLDENLAATGRPTANTLNAAEQKAAGAHNIGTDGKVVIQNQQDNAANVHQMLRQQTAAISAQHSASNQAASGSKPIVADIPNVNAAAGPNSPNQPQKVFKVAPPPPPPPPKPPEPIEQVAVQIKKAIGEGADKINIKLNPTNLGSVEVKMEIAKDGQMTASIVAEKPETLEMLQRDVRGLERALQDGGLKTDLQSFNFSLKEQAQQQAATGRDRTNKQPGQNVHVKNGGTDDDQAHDISTQAGIYGKNTATNGGVDIRI